MFKTLLQSLRMNLILMVLVGLIFPLIVTSLASSIFPDQANGSLLHAKDGHIIGSKLIGQSFNGPQYFHPRPSAAGSNGYSGEASSGTNLGPTSAKLIGGSEGFDGVKQLVQKYQQENNLKADDKVPVDAVTRSASGLDPHISEANALLQAKRVAAKRGLPLAQVEGLIRSNSEDRQLGFLGEPRVNVLTLNIALNQLGGVQLVHD